MLNLSVVHDDAARDTPDHDALVFGDQRLSYAVVNTIANQVAGLLRSRGIGPGDRIALASPTCPTSPWSTSASLRPVPWCR